MTVNDTKATTGYLASKRPGAAVPEQLVEHGFPQDVAEAMVAFDAASFVLKHALMKGDLPKQVIASLGLDLELRHFHCLTAIWRIQSGLGRSSAAQATIGLLAEELNIDPSRASRVTTDLVTKGYLRREAAQDDGRKSVMVFTPKAQTVFAKFKDIKWSKYIDVFSQWEHDDILTFSRLFNRYCTDWQHTNS